MGDSRSHDDAALRARIEARFRGTVPGGDPLQELLKGLPPDQHEELRQHVPPSLASAAVMVPIVERPAGLTVLFTLRATHLKNHGGQISFPGGRAEPGDESPWATALRETEEEIGLAREYASLVGYLHDQIVISGFRITPAVALVRPGFALQLDRTEVDEVFEVPLAFILDPVHHVPRARHFRGLTFQSFDIPWEGRNIWGATAHMLVSLYRTLQES